MSKGRSHRNRNASRRSLQRSGGVTCLPPPHSASAGGSAAGQARPGVPLNRHDEPLVTEGMSRQARRLAQREQRKVTSGSAGTVTATPDTRQPLCLAKDPDTAPLPASRSLSVPRAQWIETVRGWLGSITYRWKRSVPAAQGAVDRSALERLRRELAQTQATLDGVIAGLSR